MPVRCAVCETDNLEDAVDCAGCGKLLAAEAAGGDDAPPLAGLEPTHSAAVDVEAGPMAGLEPTGLAGRDLKVDPETLPGVERTQLDGGDLAAASSWSAGVELDLGRELDTDPRTPRPPETATCPFCGLASLDAICGGCGRRKARFVAPPPARRKASGETRQCPACFARVPTGIRCEACGVPFPLQEL